MREDMFAGPIHSGAVLVRPGRLRVAVMVAVGVAVLCFALSALAALDRDAAADTVQWRHTSGVHVDDWMHDYAGWASARHHHDRP
ncbi:hypothetical protein [Gordonia sp. NPDC003376]